MPPILDNPLFFHSAQGILFLTGAWFLCKAFPTTAFRKPLLLLLNLLFLLSFSAYVPLVVLGLALCSFLLANAVSRYRNAAFVALGAALLFATSQLLNQPMSGRGIFVTPGGAVGNHLSFSFLAFSLISTFISVHRRELEPPSLLNHALLASFFPTAVSGPILDGKNFLQQLDSPYEAPNPREVVDRFTLGLLKKTVIADRLGLLYHDIFQAYQSGGSRLGFLLFYIYAFEVYFDFSGYTDMAVSAARIAGFRVRENFHLPFLAENPVDWWRRWHISLAQFFRDHVYYPLFFLLKEIHICVFVTFLANGLWHGLYLHYFYLGLYWAFFVNAYLLFQKFWDGALPRAVKVFVTIHIAVGSFVFFIPNGLGIFLGASGLGPPPSPHSLAESFYSTGADLILLGISFLCFLLFQLLVRTSRPGWYFAAIFSVWILILVGQPLEQAGAFIYSQF